MQLAEKAFYTASAVDDVDFSAAETLRSIFGILKDKAIRLVVAQVMEDVKDESSYQLGQLFGEDAFYDTIENVLEAYRQQVSAGPAPDASDLGEGTVHTR